MRPSPSFGIRPCRPVSLMRGSGAAASRGALGGGTRITTASVGAEPSGRTTVTPDADSISSALRWSCVGPGVVMATGGSATGTGAAGRAAGSRRAIIASARGSPPWGSPSTRTRPADTASAAAIAPAATLGWRRIARVRANRPLG